MAPLRKELHEENRLAWNAATAAHNRHKSDQAGFLRAGGQTLFPEELELLGELSGQTLLHLQCNAGQDTLSLAQRGARVTGVDISDTAIEFARELSSASGIPATFARADVYDWLDAAGRAGEQFDLVFSSYGALCWLSDIQAWARGVAAVLKPGGRLVVVDFHPFAMVFDEQWQIKYNYFCEGRADSWDDWVHDYVANSGAALAPSGYVEGVKEFKNPHRAHGWEWSIAEILGAVLNAGLRLTTYREYPYSNGCRLFARMRELAGHRMVLPEDLPALPLMYGLAAHKR